MKLLNNHFSVTYTREILNPDGTTARRMPPKKNLVLDSGMDAVATEPLAQLFRYCALGTGTTPTKRLSSPTTASQSGTTVTANANFFEADDAGRRIKFNDGTEAKIVTYTSETEVTVDTSATVSSQVFGVFYTNETGHQTETKRTATCATASGDCQTTFDTAGIITHKRTFVFSAETGDVTYKEIGWSWQSTGELFGRDLISGGGDTLQDGQQYKVVVELAVTVAPSVQTPVANVGTNGYDTTGDVILDHIGPIASTFFFSNVSSSGSTEDDEGLEPEATTFVVILDQAITLPASPEATHANAVYNNHYSLSKDTYTAGDFEMTKRVVLSVGSANFAHTGLSLCGKSGSATYYDNGLVFKYDASQTKANTHTLTLVFKWTWSRSLVL